MKLSVFASALAVTIHAAVVTTESTQPQPTTPLQADNDFQDDEQEVKSSRMERLKDRAKTIYGRSKAMVINRATYYLVDYGMSLKAIAMMFGDQPGASSDNQTGAVDMQQQQTATVDMQQPQQGQMMDPMAPPQPTVKNMTEADRAALSEAIHAFLKPLKTYQQAQKQEETEKLSGSLVGMTDLLLRKAQAEADLQDNPTVNEEDYTPGQLWTTVVRKNDVNAVLAARSTLFSSKPPKTSLAKTEDIARLTKIRDYYSMLSEGDSKFNQLISPKLDWSKFEERYLEVVEKVVVKRADLVRKCRVYLGRYIQSGKSDEAYFRTLLAEVNKQQQGQVASSASNTSVSLLTIAPLLLSLLVFIL